MRIPRSLLVGGAAAALVATGAAQAKPTAPTFVQVTEKEWQITLSRPVVKPGKVFMELVNFGTDNHDLVVQKIAKKAPKMSFKLIGPNARSEKALTLAAGR